uniref:Uncharacterized protein n=1 Tax=Arundo donax TaxID=35708 RepID=A0A0A9HAB2_ARUDO
MQINSNAQFIYCWSMLAYSIRTRKKVLNMQTTMSLTLLICPSVKR